MEKDEFQLHIAYTFRHAWMSYMVDKPPSEDPIMQRHQRPWEPANHLPTMTASKSAFRTYSTYVPPFACMGYVVRRLMLHRTKNKYNAWLPKAAPR